MPHLDHKGPESLGPKTGRKLGLCKKTESEKKEMGELGKGQAAHRHSCNEEGKGKRIKYYENNNKTQK